MIASSAFGLIPGTVYAPYLDEELWQYLSGLPARMFLNHRFHIDTIARAYPDFADVPYAEPGASRFPYVRYAVSAVGSLRRPARYLSSGPVFLRLLRSLVLHRFRTEAKWVGCHMAYIQQLSSCSDCSRANFSTICSPCKLMSM